MSAIDVSDKRRIVKALREACAVMQETQRLCEEISRAGGRS